MQKAPPSIRIESRWLAGVAVMAVVALVAILPGRISLYPVWVPYALGIAMIVPMAGAVLTAGKGRWERMERITTVLFFVIVVGGALALLFNLVRAMVTGDKPAERHEGAENARPPDTVAWLIAAVVLVGAVYAILRYDPQAFTPRTPESITHQGASAEAEGD